MTETTGVVPHDFTTQRDELRAEGRDVFVDVNLGWMGERDGEIRCTLCDGPASINAGIEQEGGKCKLHIAEPDERYDFCNCYTPHRHIERHVCFDCAKQRAGSDLIGALMTIGDSQLVTQTTPDDVLRDEAVRDIKDAMRQVRETAAPLLRALGDDDATITEALDNFSVVLSAKANNIRYVS